MTLTLSKDELHRAFMYWNLNMGTPEERVKMWEAFWFELRSGDVKITQVLPGWTVKP